jgi:hypothetical protein
LVSSFCLYKLFFRGTDLLLPLSSTVETHISYADFIAVAVHLPSCGASQGARLKPFFLLLSFSFSSLSCLVWGQFAGDADEGVIDFFVLSTEAEVSIEGSWWQVTGVVAFAFSRT